MTKMFFINKYIEKTSILCGSLSDKRSRLDFK